MIDALVALLVLGSAGVLFWQGLQDLGALTQRLELLETRMGELYASPD